MQIDADKIKEWLIEHYEVVDELLESAGFDQVNLINNEYRCAWGEGLNPTAVKVNIDTMAAVAYSMGVYGDIFTLLQEKMKSGFHSVLNHVCDVCKINKLDVKSDIQVELPFGAYYKKFTKQYKDEYIDLPTYDNHILDVLGTVPNLQFYKDNISVETMEKFKCGYDTISNRWTVNWLNEQGELIGIMGRLNGTPNEYEAKWFPVIPFPKNQALYGLYENMEVIKKHKTLVIFESEKSVLQCDSFGFNCSVALGGNSLSRWQVNTIKSLFLDKIIIAMDQDLEVERSIELAKQLEMPPGYENTIQYIYDKDGVYLKKGRKESPSDLGKEVFQKLLSECTYDLS